MENQGFSIQRTGGRMMPVVICAYCEYIGQGKTLNEQYLSVEKHEKTCVEIGEEE